jgi:phosphoribosylglycinamide formyltransferase-1
MSAQHSPQKSAFKIIVLLSGKGSNLKAIIEAIEQRKLSVVIQGVISDKRDAIGLNIAKDYRIPAFFLDPKAFATRQDFDLALKNKIDSLGCELVVLAGFMRILSEDFVKHFSGKLINIHPSLLPKLKGLNTHQRALSDGETIHGCSVHYVSAELDGGPVIAQRQFNIENDDDEKTLQNKVHTLEHQLYPQVIQWIAENKVGLVNGQLKFDKFLNS